jgi:hypothetical protein
MQVVAYYHAALQQSPEALAPARPITIEPAIAAPTTPAAKEEDPDATIVEPSGREPSRLDEEQPSSPSAAEPTSPPPPAPEIPTEIKPEEIVLRLGDRKYRVRGLAKNLSYEQLRVNVLCAQGDAFHVDTLDLYSARQRALYIKQAAEELALKDDVIKKDLGKVLLKLEELQEAEIRKALEPPESTITMSETEQAAGLDLLKDPHLLDRILTDFERCGVVGEETNKLVGYLAAVSRKLDEPLAVIIQSTSAAGKTALMDAILAFMPDEEQHGQTLPYIEVTRDDIALANRLAHEVLGRSLDELAPQTRRLLILLDAMVTDACQRLELDRSDYRFSRRDVRQHTSWGHTQLKIHLHRLEELEYVLVHRGGRGQSFVYELLYQGEGQDGTPFVTGLIDPDTLAHHYDGNRSGVSANRSGSDGEKSGASRPQVGAKSGGGRAGERRSEPLSHTAFHDTAPPIATNLTLAAAPETAPSYVPARRTGVST